MPCDACYKFPAPTKNFEEVALSFERHGTLYVCKTCETLIELIAEEHSIRFPSRDTVLKFYPDAAFRMK